MRIFFSDWLIGQQILHALGGIGLLFGCDRSISSPTGGMARCDKKYNLECGYVQFRLIARSKVLCFKYLNQTHSLKILYFGKSIC